MYASSPASGAISAGGAQGIYNQSPFPVWVAYGPAFDGLAPSQVYADYSRMAGWVTEMLNPGESTACPLADQAVLVWADPSNGYFDSQWVDKVGPQDQAVPVNVTFMGNPIDNVNGSLCLWVHETNPLPPPGGPYPQQGFTYECEIEADGTTLYVAVAQFMGYVPPSGAFTWNTFMDVATGNPDLYTYLYTFAVKAGDTCTFAGLQRWQPGQGGRNIETIVFFFSDPDAGHVSYWTSAFGAVDLGPDANFVGIASILGENLPWEFHLIVHSVKGLAGGNTKFVFGPTTLPSFVQWHCVTESGDGATLLNHFVQSKGGAPAGWTGNPAPAVPRSSWVAQNKSWTQNGPNGCGYARIIDTSQCEPWKSGVHWTGQTSVLQDGHYGFPTNAHKQWPCFSGTILLTSSVKSCLQMLVFSDPDAFVQYVKVNGAADHLWVLLSDIMQPMVGVQPQYVEEKDEQVDYTNGVIALSILLLEGIFAGVKDSDIVDSAHNPTHTCNTFMPCSGEVANDLGVNWRITTPYGYNRYLAIISTIDANYDEPVQTNLCAAWVEEGRSYDLIKYPTPVLVQPPAGVDPNPKLQTYGLVDTTPLLTWYPTAASSAPFMVTNSSSMVVMVAVCSNVYDPIFANGVLTDPIYFAVLQSSPSFQCTVLQPGQSISAGANGDEAPILFFASTNSCKCAGFYQPYQKAQTYMTNGCKLVFVGSYSSGITVFDFDGANASSYSPLSRGL